MATYPAEPAPNGLDDLFTIGCPVCKGRFPVARWCSTTVLGELPAGRFQCPGCAYAFERRLVGSEYVWRGPVVRCVPVAAVL